MVRKGTLPMLGEPCLGPHFLPLAQCFQGQEMMQGEKERDGDHSFALHSASLYEYLALE
jgi:hypothetical protein